MFPSTRCLEPWRPLTGTPLINLLIVSPAQGFTGNMQHLEAVGRTPGSEPWPVVVQSPVGLGVLRLNRFPPTYISRNTPMWSGNGMTGCETRHSLRDLQRSEEAPTEFPHTGHWAAGVTCYIASGHRSSRVCGWNASLRNLDRACRRSRGFTSPKLYIRTPVLLCG